MANGIEIRLFNGATAQASLTGLTCLWWDAEDVYDFGAPQGRTDVATTDSDGDLILDISEVSGHTVGGVGYLLVRKEDVGNHEDSLVFQGKVTVSDITGGTVLKYVSGWARPLDWLAIDDVHVASENRFEGLYAVYKGGPNWCAFRFVLTSSAQYTIDWGDGSALEYVNSNVTAEHSFDYDDLAGSTEIGAASARPCTFTDAGDLVTLAGHGFRNGTEVVFATITTTTGITAYTRYWVVGVSGNDFQVAATKGGSAIALTNNGSGSVYLPGYRQAIIKVTPTTGGGVFTTVSLDYRHSSASAVKYRTGWLDVYVNGPSITTLDVGNDGLVSAGLLQQFSCPENGVSSFAGFFSTCVSLESIPILYTGSATSMSTMFNKCYSLKSIPLLDSSGCSNISYMFQEAFNLKSVPLLDTSGCTTTGFSGVFRFCRTLTSVPLFDLSNCSDISNTFSYCNSLESIPLLDFSAVTNANSAFYECLSLQSIPLLDLSACTNFANIFGLCTSMQVGAINGTSESITYPAMQLSGTQLDAIYTGLATVVGKTITVTGNYGTASDDPTIATAKGWTVTS